VKSLPRHRGEYFTHSGSEGGAVPAVGVGVFSGTAHPGCRRICYRIFESRQRPIRGRGSMGHWGCRPAFVSLDRYSPVNCGRVINGFRTAGFSPVSGTADTIRSRGRCRCITELKTRRDSQHRRLSRGTSTKAPVISAFVENFVSKQERAFGVRCGSTIFRPCPGSIKGRFFFLEWDSRHHGSMRDSRRLAIRSPGGGRRI
jgi:hypothetical protein